MGCGVSHHPPVAPPTASKPAPRPLRVAADPTPSTAPRSASPAADGSTDGAPSARKRSIFKHPGDGDTQPTNQRARDSRVSFGSTSTAAAAQSEDDDAFFSRDDSFNSGSTGHRRDDGSRSNSSHASSRDGSRRASLQELSVLRAAGDAQPPLLSPTTHRDRRSSAASVLTEWSDGGSGGAAWPPSPAGVGATTYKMQLTQAKLSSNEFGAIERKRRASGSFTRLLGGTGGGGGDGAAAGWAADSRAPMKERAKSFAMQGSS